MSDRITAVVVNWRTPVLTLAAVRALIGDGVDPSRIVIVDNGSGDGSATQLAAALAECRVHALAANVGFARASNAGAAALPAREAYLFVNSDATVHRPGSVPALLAALHGEQVGVAVPRLLNPDRSLQRSVVPFLAPGSALVRASGLSRHVPDRWQPRLGAHWSHATTQVVQSATGAVLAIRAPVWAALGGFDERRAMYVEDHDLLRRAHRAGWSTRFLADAEFVHLGGASAALRFSEPERARRIARAEAEMLRDHLSAAGRALTLGLLVAGAGGRAIVHRARGEPGRARAQRAWLRGYLDGWLL